MKILLLSIVSAFPVGVAAQTMESFPFGDYPAKVINLKKAPLVIASHKLGKQFKTSITSSYSQGKVDFGGHYITVMWGAGAGLTEGVMVDICTGKIYELPLDEDNSYRGVYHDSNNNISYKKNSNAFVCYTSSSHEGDEGKVDLKYYFYKWNDSRKKFELLKSKLITTRLIDK